MKPPTLGLLKPGCFLFSTSGVAKPHGPIPMFLRLKSQFPLEHRHFQLFEANVPFVRHILGGTKFPIWFPFPMVFPMVFPIFAYDFPTSPIIFPSVPWTSTKKTNGPKPSWCPRCCIVVHSGRAVEAPGARVSRGTMSSGTWNSYIECIHLRMYISNYIYISLSLSVCLRVCVCVLTCVYTIYISWFICSYIIKA